jgi:hypothetical protein
LLEPFVIQTEGSALVDSFEMNKIPLQQLRQMNENSQHAATGVFPGLAMFAAPAIF